MEQTLELLVICSAMMFMWPNSYDTLDYYIQVQFIDARHENWKLPEIYIGENIIHSYVCRFIWL